MHMCVPVTHNSEIYLGMHIPIPTETYIHYMYSPGHPKSVYFDLEDEWLDFSLNFSFLRVRFVTNVK